eukprot:TRINITY_DN66020_c0_g1_i1.p1 TRINITY_DN66020_c0_g1~~TRINITY_DN66020_c0_g1_i1.p1  ORF type:complete len:271 (-),score=29.97 TRINITY_DN66020_c0_g1_i1:739-1452(-)
MTIHADSDGPRSLELISLSPGPPIAPRLFLIRDLLTHLECLHIIAEAEPTLRDSTTGAGANITLSKIRTSKSTFLKWGRTKILDNILRRCAGALNVTEESLRQGGEELQVVRYELEEEYSRHYDAGRDGYNRLATLLILLHEPEEGGQTAFPLAYEDGLQVTLSQGSALLFYSQLPDGNIDKLSLHAGLPVIQGTKWVCNLWLHNHGDRNWREWEDQHKSMWDSRHKSAWPSPRNEL